MVPPPGLGDEAGNAAAAHPEVGALLAAALLDGGHLRTASRLAEVCSAWRAPAGEALAAHVLGREGRTIGGVAAMRAARPQAVTQLRLRAQSKALAAHAEVHTPRTAPCAPA